MFDFITKYPLVTSGLGLMSAVTGNAILRNKCFGTALANHSFLDIALQILQANPVPLVGAMCGALVYCKKINATKAGVLKVGTMMAPVALYCFINSLKLEPPMYCKGEYLGTVTLENGQKFREYDVSCIPNALDSLTAITSVVLCILENIRPHPRISSIFNRIIENRT